GRSQRVARAARLEVVEQMGYCVSADHRHLGSRTTAAARRLAVDEVRQRQLHVLRVRDAPAVAVRRPRGLPVDGEPAGVGKKQRAGLKTGPYRVLLSIHL